MSVKSWNGSTGFFQTAGYWSPTGAPTPGDELYIGSSRTILAGGAFGSASVRTSFHLIGNTAADTPTLVLRNVRLTKVAVSEAPPLYMGPYDGAPPGYYLPRHGIIQIIGTVMNDGGSIEAGRNDRIGGGSLDIAMQGRATLINTGSLGSVVYNRLTISGAHGGSLENRGTIDATGGPVIISAHLTGVGGVNVNNAGVGLASSVEIDAAVDAGQTFHLHRGLLQLDKPLSFLGQVDIDAQGGGAVRLEGLDPASWNAVGDIVKFFDNAGRTIDTLRFIAPQNSTTLTVYVTPDVKYGAAVNIVNTHPFGVPTGGTVLPYNTRAA